jgi:hypothetical protein
MWAVKIVLMRFFVEIKILLIIRPQAICYIVAKNSFTFCPYPETLSEAEFKNNGLINLTREISRQQSCQAVSMILLVTLSHVYN